MKYKIAVTPGEMDQASFEMMQRIFKDETMRDLVNVTFHHDNDADCTVTGVCAPVLGDLNILMNEHVRLAFVGSMPLAEQLHELLLIMRRDFLISEVRIAFVGVQPTEEDLKGVPAYGPYTEEQLLDNNNWTHYDVILARDAECIPKIMEKVTSEGMWYDASNEEIITHATRMPHWNSEGTELEDCQSIIGAAFGALDILRNRETYEEAVENPLPKLFLDRREERRNPVNFRVPCP